MPDPDVKFEFTRYRCDTRSEERWPWHTGPLLDETSARTEAARVRDVGALVRLVMVQTIPGMECEVNVELDRRPALYTCQIAGQWVAAENGGELVTWPTRDGGWMFRVPYTGPINNLCRESRPHAAANTGWPEVRSVQDAAQTPFHRYLPA